MRNVLFMYAKMNPGIKYVQGMNELLAPLVYVFAADPDPIFAGALLRPTPTIPPLLTALCPPPRACPCPCPCPFPCPPPAEHVEADCFFCFTKLMAEICDLFIRQLDTDTSGIYGSIRQLWQLLRRCDPELYSALVRSASWVPQRPPSHARPSPRRWSRRSCPSFSRSVG